MATALFQQQNKTHLWIPEKYSFVCHSFRCVHTKSFVSWSSNHEKRDNQVNLWSHGRWLYLALYNFILSMIFEWSQMSASILNYILHLFCRNKWDQDGNGIKHSSICLNQGVHLMRSLFFCISVVPNRTEHAWHGEFFQEMMQILNSGQ